MRRRQAFFEVLISGKLYLCLVPGRWESLR